jgi:hypothetical protein
LAQLAPQEVEGFKKDVEGKDKAAVKAFNAQQWQEAIEHWEGAIALGIRGELAQKIHQKVAKAHNQLDTAEADLKAAQHLAAAIMWNSHGDDRIVECLMRSSFGSFLIQAKRRPGLEPKVQFNILRTALSQFQSVDSITKTHIKAVLVDTEQRKGRVDAASIRLQMHNLRSAAILQGGQVQVQLGGSLLGQFLSLEQRVDLHIGCIDWLGEGVELLHSTMKVAGEHFTEHNSLEALRCAAKCWEVMCRAHERLGAMAVPGARAGQSTAIENLTKSQFGVESSLRNALELRKSAGDQARSQIRHLAKPDEDQKDSWTAEQTAQAAVLVQHKADAQFDRFREAKLKQELGNLRVVQDKHPKAARGFLDGSIEGFEVLADQDAKGMGLDALREMANSHCLVSQFSCRKKKYGPSREELKKAEGIFTQLNDADGAKMIALASGIISSEEKKQIEEEAALDSLQEAASPVGGGRALQAQK